jgi:hypothetical protein
MRRAAATVALLILAVPAVAGVAAWSGCALPEPTRCCCPAGDDGCGCGCGAAQAPARAPEPVAPLPQAPEPALAAEAAVAEAPVGDETQPLAAGSYDQARLPAADLLLSICSFRC